MSIRTASLKGALRSLGMERVFSGQADLSGIGGSPGDLFVSEVVHQSFVKVDEKGTEAAAATGAGIALTSMPVREKPVEFRADHPFLFIIRGRDPATVLFIGRVMDPTK